MAEIRSQNALGNGECLVSNQTSIGDIPTTPILQSKGCLPKVYQQWQPYSLNKSVVVSVAPAILSHYF
jgi:hypothetical protein